MSYSHYYVHGDKHFEPFIDPITLRRWCPLDNERNIFENDMVGPIGKSWNECRLEALPVEVYHACLQYLDIASLTTLRRVSQYTRSTIDSLHQYQELYQHAPQALRAFLATGVAASIPLLRLHGSLTSMECHYCRTYETPYSTFGAYLSIFSGHRICLFCIRNDLRLKPVDLSTLLYLCCKRSSQLSSISSLNFLHTIPGNYGLDTLTHNPRSTILLGRSVKAVPGAELTEKEDLALYGKAWTTVTHHPFVSPVEESDILPLDYVQPDKSRHINMRYMSAVSLPYLSFPKTSLDRGVLCKECVLNMQYAEHCWTTKQAWRRRHHRDPVASLHRRELINQLRKAACRQFTTSEEALGDAYVLVEKGQLLLEDWMEGMSMQGHMVMHKREKRVLSEKEVEWRAGRRGSALPVLGEEREWF